MEQPILQVEHLTKFFSVGPHAEVHAVDDVNFTPVSYTHLGAKFQPSSPSMQCSIGRLRPSRVVR